MVACGGFPTRPEGFMYSIDTEEGVAYQFKVPTNPLEQIEFTEIELPIEQIDKYICASPEYTLELRRWAEQVIKHAEENCK